MCRRAGAACSLEDGWRCNGLLLLCRPRRFDLDGWTQCTGRKVDCTSSSSMLLAQGRVHHGRTAAGGPKVLSSSLAWQKCSAGRAAKGPRTNKAKENKRGREKGPGGRRERLRRDGPLDSEAEIRRPRTHAPPGRPTVCLCARTAPTTTSTYGVVSIPSKL